MFVSTGDPSDPSLDDFRDLTDVGSRIDLETGGPGRPWFVAEGTTVVERLLDSPLTVRSVVVAEKRADRIRQLLEARAVSCVVVPQHVLNQVVGFDAHRGVFASAERPAAPSIDEVASHGGLVAVLEGINDHENLGAVLRSAAALGVSGAVLDPSCADPFYRRSVRVSMGAVFSLPITRARQWPSDLASLRDRGFTLLAMTPAADAAELHDVEGSGPVAVLLGAEGPGLRSDTLHFADRRVRIPMRSGMDSLNVGHAAAIAFHALRR